MLGIILFTIWPIHSTKEGQEVIKSLEKVKDLFFTSCPDLIPGLKTLKCRILFNLKNLLSFEFLLIARHFFFKTINSQDLNRDEALRKYKEHVVPLGPQDQMGRHHHDHPAETRTRRKKQIELLFLCVLTIMIFPPCPHLFIFYFIVV